MNKRGSHVGVILSFAIFVVFVVFIILLTRPAIKTPNEKQYLVDYLKDEIIKNTTAELASTTIKIKSDYTAPQGTDCFIIENLNENLNSLAKDEYGNIVESSTEKDKVYVKWEDQSKKFYNIYYSKEFSSNNHNSWTCVELSNDDYNLGLSSITNYAFENKIIKIFKEYNSNYDSLKAKLKIAPDSDFSMSFKFSNETIINATKQHNAGDVYVSEISIPYINKEARINYGKLTVIVW